MVKQANREDNMIELVYDSTAVPAIREKFPHVVVEDASDPVHENRVQITLPDTDKHTFYKDAIVHGYSDVCLRFQMMLLTAEGRGQIHDWLAEVDSWKQPEQEGAQDDSV